MTLTFKLIYFCFVMSFWRCSCFSQSISLIGSRFIDQNSTYKAYILSNGINDKNFKIDVAFGPKGRQQSIIKTVDQSSFEELSFNVPPEQINDYELKFSTNLPNMCREQSINLVTTSNVPIVFIQFNKPIYKTNEIFEFKTFILSQKLIPLSNITSMNIQISTPKRNVFSHDNISGESKYGVYENSIKLWDIPNLTTDDLGIWTIFADVDGKNVSKSFEVQYIDKDDTEFFVQVPQNVAFADRIMYMNIFTKNQKNRFVSISLTARFVNSSRVEINKHIKSVYLTGPKTVISLDFQKDFGIQFPTSDLILTFTVDMVKDKKFITTTVKEVKLNHKERHTIKVVRKKYFKPGFKFPIKIRVKLLNGKPDNSLNQLTTTVTYLSSSKDGKFSEEEKNYETNLKNGETVYVLQPKSKTIKILLKMKFADTEYFEEIEKFPVSDEFMQVSMLNKSSTVGSKIQIKVQSTDEMEQLNLLIFGTKGIIYSQQFEDVIGMDVFEFPLELTDEMRPEARGLVFYISQKDGAMIYDEFSISIGFSIDNFLNISAPEKANPNEIVDIKVETEKNSLVYLTMIDANSDLFVRDNEISRTSIYNEIAYHLNRKFKNPSEYQFEKLNAFVLEPMKNGYNCNSSQNNNLNENDSLEGVTTDATYQKYFPEVIPVKNFKAKNQVEKVKIKIPESTTKWKIYGISVHPNKGFTVSKNNPEISVEELDKKGVELFIKSPSKINQGKIHKVEVIAKNMEGGYLNGIITLTIIDGILLDERITQKSNTNLEKSYYRNENPLRINIQFNPQKFEDNKMFHVTPNGIKPIKIIAKFESDVIKVEAISDIQVEESKNNQKL